MDPSAALPNTTEVTPPVKKGEARSTKAYAADAALVYTAQAVSAAFPLIVSPLLVRTAGLHIFGEYALMLVAAQAACVVSEYSFDAVGPRLVAERYSTPTAKTDSSGVIFTKVIAAKLILLPAGLLIATIATVLMFHRAPTPLQLLGTLLMATGLALQSGWFLIATRQTRLLATAIVVGRILSVGIIVVLIAAHRYTASELFLATALGVLSSGTIAFAFNGEVASGQRRLRFDIGLLGVGAPAFGGFAASAAQNFVGQAAVGVALGPAGAGVYAAVDRIARTASAALKPLFMTLYPRMARLHKDEPKAVVALINIALTCWLAFSFLALAVTIEFGADILRILYGARLADTAVLLTTLVGWLCVGTLNNIVGIQGLLAAGKDRVYALGMWIGLASTLLSAGVFLAFRKAPESVALAVLLGECAVLTSYAGPFLKLRRRSHA